MKMLVTALMLIVSCIASQPKNYVLIAQRTYNLEEMHFIKGEVEIVMYENIISINRNGIGTLYSVYGKPLKYTTEGNVRGLVKGGDSEIYSIYLNLQKRYLTISKITVDKFGGIRYSNPYLWFDGIKVIEDNNVL